MKFAIKLISVNQNSKFVYMKTMWRMILVLIVVTSCNRWENIVGNPDDPPENIDEMVISPSFDWRTSLNVAFYIKNAPLGIINITSEDKLTTFHRGYYNGQVENYHIIVNLPYYMENVRVNDELVAIDSNVIIYTLSDNSSKLKSLKASASSLSFDGENDYVEVDRKMINNYPFTIGAWIKSDGFSNEDEDMVIISLADPKKNDRYYGIFIGEDEDGKACIRARKGPEKTVFGTTVITDGKWHHIVGVFATKNSRKLYVDGKLEASDGRKVDYSKAELLSLGRWGDKTPISYFDGNIDEAQIWSKALSANEIASFYNNNPAGDEDDLEAYYKLNSGEGNSIVDEISGNSEGDFNGGVSWSNEGIGSGGGIGVGDDDDTDEDGVNNGDDDYPNDDTKTFLNTFPANSFGTLAFEDLWPARGDYDFNDLVIDYQFRTITNTQNYVTEIQADFVIRAIGASFKNGFGFQFPNSIINNNDITVIGYNVVNNYINLSPKGIENSQNKPTVIVFDNAFDIMPRISGEMGVNTDPEASVTEPDTIKIIMSFKPNQYTENQINLSNFNPFIIVDMTRGKEIHLANYPPTNLVNDIYFNTLHDDSDKNSGRYYKTESNLPWAINIYQSFDYPIEKSAIIAAHLKFAFWAESNGQEFDDWYLNKTDYRNADNIY